MDAQRPIGVLVGSLRRGSYTRMAAKAAVALAPPGFACDFVEIGDLPFYNQDLDDEDVPHAWIAFRKKIKAFDAILFATPEYNRSVPAALKNAIDVGSRPRQQNAWDGKPAAVMSVSPGNISGFGANHHLRQSLVFVNMPTLQQPEAYIGGAAKLFDEAGKLQNEDTRLFLRGFMEAFAAWIGKVAPRPAA
jgi:chromate reductase